MDESDGDTGPANAVPVVPFAAAACASVPREIVPHATCRYPTPLSPSGHETLTQLPSSRTTTRLLPRGAFPITALPVLGDLWTSADVVVTTNSGS